MRVHHFQEEVAEEMAWQEGMIILTTDIGKVNIQLAKKHWQAFKPILKRTIEINMKEKEEEYGETVWKASTKISVDFMMEGEGGFTKPAYDMLQGFNK